MINYYLEIWAQVHEEYFIFDMKTQKYKFSAVSDEEAKKEVSRIADELTSENHRFREVVIYKKVLYRQV